MYVSKIKNSINEIINKDQMLASQIELDMMFSNYKKIEDLEDAYDKEKEN